MAGSNIHIDLFLIGMSLKRDAVSMYSDVHEDEGHKPVKQFLHNLFDRRIVDMLHATLFLVRLSARYRTSEGPVTLDSAKGKPPIVFSLHKRKPNGGYLGKTQHRRRKL